MTWLSFDVLLRFFERIVWQLQLHMSTGDLSEVSGGKFCDLWTSHDFGKDSHQEMRCFTLWQTSGQGEPDAVESKAGSLRCDRQITLPKCTIFRYRICRFTITCKKQNKTWKHIQLFYVTKYSVIRLKAAMSHWFFFCCSRCTAHLERSLITH